MIGTPPGWREHAEYSSYDGDDGSSLNCFSKGSYTGPNYHWYTIPFVIDSEGLVDTDHMLPLSLSLSLSVNDSATDPNLAFAADGAY